MEFNNQGLPDQPISNRLPFPNGDPLDSSGYDLGENQNSNGFSTQISSIDSLEYLVQANDESSPQLSEQPSSTSEIAPSSSISQTSDFLTGHTSKVCPKDIPSTEDSQLSVSLEDIDLLIDIYWRTVMDGVPFDQENIQDIPNSTFDEVSQPTLRSKVVNSLQAAFSTALDQNPISAVIKAAYQGWKSPNQQ